MKTKKWVTKVFEGGRDTIFVTIYFSFKKFYRNKKNRVMTSYFNEFCHDRTFNVATKFSYKLS